MVVSEWLTLTPSVPVPVHVYNDPKELHQLQVASGAFQSPYQARVHRSIETEDLNAAEVPIWQLPDGVLQYLLPTRNCNPDLLSHARQKLFGGLPPGHARVNAICNWINSQNDY